MMPFRYLHLEKVGSTNAYLQEMREQERISCVVYVDEQTAGKGMGFNGWESEPGMNLTFSIGCDMSFLKAADQFLLSQSVPLGLLDILDGMLPKKTFVKWPNDLIVEGRKMAGILINSTVHGMDMGVSVIGIGLNVNQMQFQDWPTYPVSMKMLLGCDVALEPLLHQLVEAIDRRVQSLRTEEGIAEIKKDYLARLYRYHTWAFYEVDGQMVKRYITGIDAFGRLETIDESEEKNVYDIKEIRFLPKGHSIGVPHW